jgi:hypothetical protein
VNKKTLFHCFGEWEENLREFELKLKKQWRDLEGFGADERI